MPVPKNQLNILQNIIGLTNVIPKITFINANYIWNNVGHKTNIGKAVLSFLLKLHPNSGYLHDK